MLGVRCSVLAENCTGDGPDGDIADAFPDGSLFASQFRDQFFLCGECGVLCGDRLVLCRERGAERFGLTFSDGVQLRQQGIRSGLSFKTPFECGVFPFERVDQDAGSGEFRWRLSFGLRLCVHAEERAEQNRYQQKVS